LPLRTDEIPEMLDRTHAVELGDTGARRGDHGLARRVRNEMHVKFAQPNLPGRICKPMDRYVDKTDPFMTLP